MKNNKKIKLYASCIPVKGAERSMICDLERNSYIFIPNDLYEILVLYEGNSITDICKIYNNLYDDIIEEYIEFLLKNEYIFFTDSPHLFPKMSLDWYEPFEINNAIIDISKEMHFDVKSVLFQLNELKCRSIEIRFFDIIKISLLNDLLTYIEEGKFIISSIGIVVSKSQQISINSIKKLIYNYPRISYCIIYNCSEKLYVDPIHNESGYIYCTKEKIDNNSHCGVISDSNFVLNIKTFTESQKHNTCLNGKISLDINGNIKNCPSIKKNYGNININSLQEAISNADFKELWKINKDSISVCKDCEFRYICTDCRAYLENPIDIYSKPLKCGYSPYTNKWEEWSDNPLKKKSINFYKKNKIM